MFLWLLSLLGVLLSRAGDGNIFAVNSRKSQYIIRLTRDAHHSEMNIPIVPGVGSSLDCLTGFESWLLKSGDG